MSAGPCGCGQHSGVCALEPCCPRCQSAVRESNATLYGVAGLVVLLLILLTVALPG